VAEKRQRRAVGPRKRKGKDRRYNEYKKIPRPRSLSRLSVEAGGLAGREKGDRCPAARLEERGKT